MLGIQSDEEGEWVFSYNSLALCSNIFVFSIDPRIWAEFHKFMLGIQSDEEGVWVFSYNSLGFVQQLSNKSCVGDFGNTYL